MPSSRTLISSQVLSSAAASVTFSSIPSIYTDLIALITIRSDSASTENSLQVRVNGSNTSYSETYMRAQGGSTGSGRGSFGYLLNSYATNGSASTANTFGTSEHYFPNYAGSANKVIGEFSVSEGNDTTYPGIAATAGLWSNTSAITSITFTPSGAVNGFVSGSSFRLYGIKNS
jgi:hypothetical protein